MATSDNRWTYIYVLIDPRTSEVRYVGQTVNPPERLRLHIKDCRSNTKKNAWIRSVLRSNHKPLLLVVDCVRGEAHEREAFWLDHYRKRGAQLTNLADAGGCGPRGMKLPWSDERRKAFHEAVRCGYKNIDYDGIRTTYAGGGVTQRQVAAMFGTTQGHVWKVVNDLVGR
jgi:hypothetical protein